MTDDVLNPYAAPVDLSAPPALVSPGLFYRDGKFLRVFTEAELPLICPVSGDATTPQDWRKKKSLVWTPPWVFIGIAFITLPALILAVVLQKKGKLTYSLSAATVKKIRTRFIIAGVLMAIAIALFFVAAGASSQSQLPTVALAGVLVFIASVVFLAIANPVKAVGYNKGWFKLKGCSPDFLATLPEFPYLTAKDIPDLRR